MVKQIAGGVCAPQGFRAAGVYCGVHPNRQKADLGLIVSDCPAAAAAVFTTNKVKAAPILVCQEHVARGVSRAVIVNSGNANACAPHSLENAYRMAQALGDQLGIKAEEVLVASTGVIGQPLNIAAIERGVSGAVAALSYRGSYAIAQAILTTDLRKKEVAVTCEIDGKCVTIGGVAKGSGMIHPNMGTMLAFLTSDCAINSALLQELLCSTVKRTFNRISIDGDTSTNDTCAILCNGMAENDPIITRDSNYYVFADALLEVMTFLAREIARDGEGARHLITCQVQHGDNETACEILAKSVISSSLVKAAIGGGDANWGRILCALGYAGVQFNPAKVDIVLGGGGRRVLVCRDGAGLAFDEELAAAILRCEEITIEIDLKGGDASVTAWGCDLTTDYVNINGNYRT